MKDKILPRAMDSAQLKNRLLLVDGDPKSLRVLDVSLKKAGFDVTVATSGREAISHLEASKPDLIISDTDLDEMDGFELCRQIKSRSEWAKIPFLFVSGRKSIEDKIRGLELGVDDYLTKPIYIKEIGIRVRTALQRAERERMESHRDGRTRFAGDLSDVGVVDLVQTIELNRKSGIIHIINPHERRGSIFFRDGKVIDAEVGRLTGAHALYRLFSWAEGQFAVEFKQIRRHDVIALPMAPLLMEGMRRLDESAYLLEQMPPQRSVLEVDCRILEEHLADLPDEMNAILRLCDGVRTLQEVVEDSDAPDLEVLHLIHKLLADEIIFAREAPERSGETETGDHLARWLSEGGSEDGIAAEDGDGSEETATPIELLPEGESIPTVTPSTVRATARFVAESSDDFSSTEPSPPDTPASLPGPSGLPRATDLMSSLSAEESLGVKFPVEAEDEADPIGGTSRLTDTLKGIPIEGLFSDDEPAPIPVEPSPAIEASDAAVPTTVEPRSTKPLGLAERLLSEDSVVRGSALREGISDDEGTVASPASADRNTREYGDPALQAAALVFEIVSSSRESKPESPPHAQPERPAKEVDWGAWSTSTATESPAPTEAVPIPLHVRPPSPSPSEAGQANRNENQIADQHLGATSSTSSSQLPRGMRDEPAHAGPHQAPRIVTPLAEERLHPPPTEDLGEPDSFATPSAAELVVPRSEAAAPAAWPEPFGDETAVPGRRAWRAWAVALAAFAVGGVGYLAWTKIASSPDEKAKPSAQRSPRTETTSASEPATSDHDAGAAAALANRRRPAPGLAAPAAAPVPSSPPAEELRKKCLEADANGEGKARVVIPACRPALDADPTAVDVMLILARAALDRGHLIEARALAKKALAADPKSAEAYVYLGNAEQEAGNVDKARMAYKKYLELAPDGPFAPEMRSILNNM